MKIKFILKSSIDLDTKCIKLTIDITVNSWHQSFIFWEPKYINGEMDVLILLCQPQTNRSSAPLKALEYESLETFVSAVTIGAEACIIELVW